MCGEANICMHAAVQVERQQHAYCRIHGEVLSVEKCSMHKLYTTFYPNLLHVDCHILPSAFTFFLLLLSSSSSYFSKPNSHLHFLAVVEV